MDKKLQKGILAVLIANMINVIFSLANNFLLPKYLPIESYAGIKEFQLYVSYVGLFHLGFVDGIYLKYGGRTLGKEIDGQFTTDLSTMCIFQMLTTLAVLIVAVILRNRIFFVFAISILPQNMSNYFKFLYQATGAFNAYGKAMNLTTISTFALNMVLLFVIRTDDVFCYILGYIILYFLIWAVLNVYFRKKYVLQKGIIFCCKSFVTNIRSGFLLMLGNLSSIFLTSMDRWFVKAFMDTIAFAQYSFAVSVENFLNVAITPVTTTLYNYFCHISNETEQRKVLNYIIIFATVIPVAAFPVKFILEVYLTQYLDSSAVVFLLFATQIFYVVIKSIYINLYKVQRKQNRYFVKLLIILAVEFMLNYVCYAVVQVKESFAVGTLLSAIMWFYISKADFKYLGSSRKAELYLFVQLVLFLALGLTLPSIIGCMGYIIVTIISARVLMKETFYDLVNHGVGMINRRGIRQ